MIGVARIDHGYGLDWCQYENNDGYMYLEELIIYQTNKWRKQVREYIYMFHFDVEMRSFKSNCCTKWMSKLENIENMVPIMMRSPILVVLYHPEMKCLSRYDTINFLLVYSDLKLLPNLYNAIIYIVGYDLNKINLEEITDRLKALDIHSRNNRNKYEKLTRRS